MAEKMEKLWACTRPTLLKNSDEDYAACFVMQIQWVHWHAKIS